MMLFVVGNSRSGTTMMGRILGRGSDVFMLNELHFFEQLWAPETDAGPLDEDAAARLFARLAAIERNGYFTQGDPSEFLDEARIALAETDPASRDAPTVFATFLIHEAGRNGASIPCEQTPRNVHYLSDILTRYPNARVVNMVRDPRDVMLSQKNRWRRSRLSGAAQPLSMTLLSWANYHPWFTSKFWNASIVAANRFRDDPRVAFVRFEALLSDPEAQLRTLCERLGLPYEPDMLNVPRIGSSTTQDDEGVGIDANKTQKWRTGLSAQEIATCETLCAENMRSFGYEPSGAAPGALSMAKVWLTLPVKAGVALAMNLRRAKNIVGLMRRRFRPAG